MALSYICKQNSDRIVLSRPGFWSKLPDMTERNSTIPGVRNVARRRETIFRKCHELSKFGVGVWVVICTGARDTMFKSSNTALFEQLDREMVCMSIALEIQAVLYLMQC